MFTLELPIGPSIGCEPPSPSPPVSTYIVAYAYVYNETIQKQTQTYRLKLGKTAPIKRGKKTLPLALWSKTNACLRKIKITTTRCADIKAISANFVHGRKNFQYQPRHRAANLPAGGKNNPSVIFYKIINGEKRQTFLQIHDTLPHMDKAPSFHPAQPSPSWYRGEEEEHIGVIVKQLLCNSTRYLYPTMQRFLQYIKTIIKNLFTSKYLQIFPAFWKRYHNLFNHPWKRRHLYEISPPASPRVLIFALTRHPCHPKRRRHKHTYV